MGEASAQLFGTGRGLRLLGYAAAFIGQLDDELCHLLRLPATRLAPAGLPDRPARMSYVSDLGYGFKVTSSAPCFFNVMTCSEGTALKLGRGCESWSKMREWNGSGQIMC